MRLPLPSSDLQPPPCLSHGPQDFKNISNLNSSHYKNPTWNDSNDTKFWPSLFPHEVATVVIYVVILVVGVPGNLLVLWVTSCEARRSINAIWFLNLAVADLLSCLVLPIHIVTAMSRTWPLGKKTCPILHSFFDFNLYASVLLLTIISADRFLIVFRPIWCQKYRVALWAWLASGVTWMLALVFTIPSFVFRDGYEDSDSKWGSCFVEFMNSSVKLADTVTQFALTFLVPLVTMSFCYTLLLLRTWRRPATRSTKTLKVVVAVVTSFFIFWVPYQSVRILLACIPNSRMYESLNRIDTALAYINCCINPVIYVAAARGLHIRVFKFRPGRLRQLLTED